MNLKVFLIIVFGFLFFTGCGKTLQNTTEIDTKAPVASITNSSSEDNTENNINYLIFNTYKAVLTNNTSFFSTDNKKNIYLKDFLTNEQIYGTVLNASNFTIIDVDQDKIPEIVLELSDKGNSPICYEVLRFINNQIYGYNIVYRGLQNLKTDGTFIYSNSAADNGSGKLSFASNECKTITLGDSKLNEGKSDVIWYEFSIMNIEAKLNVNQ